MLSAKRLSDLPLTIKVEEMAQILCVSKKVAYKLANSNDFPAAVRIGEKRIVIITEKLNIWLDQKAKKESIES